MKLIKYLNDKYTMLRFRYDSKIVKKGMAALEKKIDSNIMPCNIKRIVFVLDNMLKYSGGHTSILRLATELCKNGFNVFYLLLNNQNIEEAKMIATYNLEGYEGEFIDLYNFQSSKDDIVIATASNTAFDAVNFQGYKMYFVQDYEPTFFPLGDRYLMAKKTYELGFHIVSLGKWNEKMIKKECSNLFKVDHIQFPCNLCEYPTKKRNFNDLKEKKKITIVAYVKFVGRRLPLITQELLFRTKKKFKAQGIDIDILYFGENRSLKCLGGKNLGKLSKAQLRDLYYSADFGYVSSLSNVSLVPYEMISSGLPVIEIKDGSFLDFFPENCGIITEINSEDLYEKLLFYINNPSELNDLMDNALRYIKQLSWKSSAREFVDIIENAK